MEVSRENYNLVFSASFISSVFHPLSLILVILLTKSFLSFLLYLYLLRLGFHRFQLYNFVAGVFGDTHMCAVRDLNLSALLYDDKYVMYCPPHL
jgi:hypothetical protein